MARADFDAWVPEEEGSEVLQRVNQTSAIEAFARPEPMGSSSKTVPRSAGVGVAVVEKGGAYGEDTSANDEITLVARKFGRAIRIAEEDLDDSPIAIIETKQRDWATSYAVALDNACLAVTAAANGTTIPFTSVYRALSQANAATGYTGGDNVVTSATAVAVTYDDVSNVLGLYEGGAFFDEGNTIVIASPHFKKVLRGIKDDQGAPVFVRGQGSDAGTPDMLFDYPIAWSRGARTSAVNTDAPAGSPILVVANRDFIILGRRSGPESVFIDGRSGTSALTDESLLKMRSRRGFGVGNEHAVALLEDVP